MKEVKTCRDAFVLPLIQNGVEICEQSATGFQNYDVASFSYAYQARFAANAINHVDALAEALEAIVSDYNQYRAVNGIDLTDDHCAKLDVKMATAEAALAAYRGEI